MARIVVGQVEVRGEFTYRQVRVLLRDAAAIAALIGSDTSEEEKEEVAGSAVSIGFATEISQFEERDMSEWFEEAP